MQLAEVALQLAACSLGSRSRDEEEEEEEDDRVPVRLLVVHQARRLGHGEGRGGRGERASAGSLAPPRKIIKEEGLDIVRAVVKSESNSVPFKRVPSTESSNATRSTRGASAGSNLVFYFTFRLPLIGLYSLHGVVV